MVNEIISVLVHQQAKGWGRSVAGRVISLDQNLTKNYWNFLDKNST